MRIKTQPAFLTCVILLLLISPAQAGQQEDLEKLRKRISSLQREMDKADDSRAQTADALRESEQAISHSNRLLHKLTIQQREANNELNKLQQQTRNISADMQEQQVLLSRLLLQQYIHGEQEYFKLLLDNKDPNQTARNLQYYEYIVKSRSEWLNGMRSNLTKLKSATQQVRSKNAELDALKAEQAAQKQALTREKYNHQQVLRRIATQLKQQHKELAHLQRNENQLTRLVEKLSDIVKDQPSTSITTQSHPHQLNSKEISFVSLRGKLNLPVRGRITNKYGGKRPDSPILWKGLFLQASASQPVSVIASGRVIYADWLRGFGNLLIVDHGAGYMSLYGNNEALLKQVGDDILAGETIATVGNSGGNENYGLYFELRYKGNPLDPSTWIKGRNSRTR